MAILILLSLHELLSIFTKKKLVILMIQKFENLDSLMRTKYISFWINQNSAIMEEWRYLTINARSVFKTQWNIYDGAFLRK